MPGPLRLLPLLALAFVALSQPAYAGNTPCSGAKGGISRCDGDLFLCNDGSISGSKRNCSFYLDNPDNSSTQAAPSIQRFNEASGECICGTGFFCTGQRGGVYCLTPTGRKSYVRK